MELVVPLVDVLVVHSFVGVASAVDEGYDGQRVGEGFTPDTLGPLSSR